jgi:Holliday junction resolvase
MGKPSRDKGRRYELEVVQWHKDLGLRAERVPLSGAARYQGNAGDVDIYLNGDHAPLVAECKIRAKLPKCWRDWLGENCAVFMRDNGGETMVILPARTWAKMVKR